MLPDFPALKREIATRLARAAQSVARGGPLLRDISSFQQHEGDRTNLARADGSVGTMTYDTPLTAEAVIRVDEARRDGPAASIRAMQEVGAQLAAGMEKRMFETISEAVEAVGNVVNGGGQPFSVELFIEALEKMELTFDENGEWQPPTMVVPSGTLEKVGVQLKALDQDPAAKARVDAVVDRKRGEWRAREAGRALVD